MANNFLDFPLYPVSEWKPDSDIKKAQVLVLYLIEEELNVANEELLHKILAAVKLDVAQNVFLYKMTATDAVNLHQLAHKIEAKEVLVFGIAPKKLGLNVIVENYIPFSILKLKILMVENLSLYSNDRNKKALLWNALQQVFL